jgi:hypothetical protein
VVRTQREDRLHGLGAHARVAQEVVLRERQHRRDVGVLDLAELAVRDGERVDALVGEALESLLLLGRRRARLHLRVVEVHELAVRGERGALVPRLLLRRRAPPARLDEVGRLLEGLPEQRRGAGEVALLVGLPAALEEGLGDLRVSGERGLTRPRHDGDPGKGDGGQHGGDTDPRHPRPPETPGV